jgi:curved DNA-binding protein CbpA
MDAFALLNLPRRVWLDPDEVRAAFQKAAAACHPDGAGDEADRGERTRRFQQLNEASAILTPVAARLRHWLSLEFPDYSPPRAAVMDDALVRLFGQVGAAVQEAAGWTRKVEAATTFLAKAALTRQGLEVQEALEAAGAEVRAAHATMEASLREIDAAHGKGTEAEVAAVLGPLSQRAGFLEKWQAQLQSAWAAVYAAGL